MNDDKSHQAEATFDFAVKLAQSQLNRFGMSGSRTELDQGSASSVRLISRDGSQPIRDSDALTLRGGPFDSPAAAEQAASVWMYKLQVAAASLHMGLDYGFRAAGPVRLSGSARKDVEVALGADVVGDAPGPLIFQTGQPPMIFSGTVSGHKVQSEERLLDAIARTGPRLHEPSDALLLSLELFGAAFFLTSADARLLTLVSAVEALCADNPRSPTIQDHIDSLVAITKSVDLDVDERASLIGSLRSLKRESVGAATKRLVAHHLGDRIYDDMPAGIFFRKCYTMRSQLTHGSTQRPSWDDVSRVGASLELLVGDLITSFATANRAQ